MAKEPVSKTNASLWSRRDFVGRMGWGMFHAFTGLTLLGFLRSAFPRVLFVPPTSFKGLQIIVSVADEFLYFGKQMRIRPTTIE